MARFRYRMQAILDLKLKTEAQARMDFGVAQMKLNEEEDKLEALRQRKRDYEDEGVRLRQADILNIEELRWNETAVKNMDTLIADQQINVDRAEEALDKERIKLTKNVQERKMQETLRDHAFQEYLAEEKDAEFKESDQRTSFTYGQRIREKNGNG